jgi:mannose-6-phosphate isomerase-like protein (cupin superfamily)
VNIEEIYFVLEGEVTVKLGDDVVTLGPRDAVLIPPSTPRAARNETDRPAALMMISTRVEDIRSESVAHEGFWPEASA